MLVGKNRRNRKLNRLKDYDYNLEGFYFVTICIKDRIEYFGYIKDNKMILNQYGEIAKKYWQQIPDYYQNVTIDKFIIMPNHVHGIIQITKPVVTGQCPVPTRVNYGLLSKIVNSFKNMVTKEIRKNFNNYEFQWQRSFYDHIIRNEKVLNKIYEYIKNNPL